MFRLHFLVVQVRNDYFFLLFGFIRRIIVYNSFSASVPVSDTSAPLLGGVRAVCNPPPNIEGFKVEVLMIVF